ncbi:MAG: hypothetical protein HWE20_14680 [Gammaproteobacteria bacterium]|nr:hypothetical protein [Gammaproteobacteria bacterium]
MGLSQFEKDTREQFHTLFVRVEAMAMELALYAHEGGMTGYSRVTQQLIDTLGDGKSSSHLLFQLRSLMPFDYLDKQLSCDARELLDELDVAVHEAETLIANYVQNGGSI